MTINHNEYQNQWKSKITQHCSFDFYWFSISINWLQLIDIDWYWLYWLLILIDYWFSLIEVVWVHVIIKSFYLLCTDSSFCKNTDGRSLRSCSDLYQKSIYLARPSNQSLGMDKHWRLKSRENDIFSCWSLLSDDFFSQNSLFYASGRNETSAIIAWYLYNIAQQSRIRL